MPLFRVYKVNYSCHYTALADHRVMKKKKGTKNSHTSLEVALRLYKKRGKITTLSFCMSRNGESSLTIFSFEF